MKAAGLSRQQFDFEYNEVEADTFFFIDQNPFILAFGLKLTRTYFEIEIESKNLQTADFFTPELYKTICREFHIKYDPNHTYKPIDFLKAINKEVPQHVKNTRKTKPSNMIRYHRDVDEAEKIYFCGFLDNNKAGTKVRNLEKTRLLMGEKAYITCKQENLSTKWTDDPKKDKYNHWEELRPEVH